MANTDKTFSVNIERNLKYSRIEISENGIAFAHFERNAINDHYSAESHSFNQDKSAAFLFFMDFIKVHMGTVNLI